LLEPFLFKSGGKSRKGGGRFLFLRVYSYKAIVAVTKGRGNCMKSEEPSVPSATKKKKKKKTTKPKKQQKTTKKKPHQKKK